MRRLLFGFFAAVLMGAAPPPLELTAEETATASSGEPALRYVETDQGGEVVGIIDVSASTDAVLSAALDFDARKQDTSAIVSITKYEDTPSRQAVRWELSVIGTSVVFHSAYAIDRAAGFVAFDLDSSKPNDMVTARGSYQAYDIGGKTRLVYRSMSDSGRPIPGFVKRRIAGSSLVTQLQGIRRRAEASGQ